MRLIERAWYQNHPVKWLLLPLNLLFWLLSALRRVLFKLGVLKQEKLNVPVVIVGNIGVGGNGKTPMVIYLIEQLSKKGLNVGVISRGYGGSKHEEPLLVTDEITAVQAGDEPVLIYQRCKVPVMVSSDRVSSVKKLMTLGCNIIISDDGLQHYKLKRDVELVIVDGKRRFGNGWLMPAGPLREGLWRLKTVDKIIVNGGLAGIGEDSMTLHGNELININSQQRIDIKDFLESPLNSKINALAGIGNPERFFISLNDLGFSLNKKVGFVDHHKYNADDFADFEQDMALLMTEKDAVKCRGLVNDNTWYLPVNAHFELQQGEQIIDLIMTRSKSYGL